MTVTMEQIKDLRSRTGAGVVDAKEALTEAKGDIEGAIDLLRKKGKASAAKKAERETKEGVVASYIHSNNKLGVLVSLQCETDFVARNERFQEIARDIALHVAASDPVVVAPEDVPADAIEKEKKFAMEQAEAEGKPKEIQEKMVEGKMKKFREERALLTQPFVKDPSKTIGDILHEAVTELGENITIGGFSRLDI